MRVKKKGFDFDEVIYYMDPSTNVSWKHFVHIDTPVRGDVQGHMTSSFSGENGALRLDGGGHMIFLTLFYGNTCN